MKSYESQDLGQSTCCDVCKTNGRGGSYSLNVGCEIMLPNLGSALEFGGNDFASAFSFESTAVIVDVDDFNILDNCRSWQRSIVGVVVENVQGIGASTAIDGIESTQCSGSSAVSLDGQRGDRVVTGGASDGVRTCSERNSLVALPVCKFKRLSRR